MKAHFEKITSEHLDIILHWLAEDFVREHWDNTQAHKDDIINFAQGRKIPSAYANGKYVYWIAKSDHEPFALLMTIQETHEDNIAREKRDGLSQTGNTYGIDYMIGNPDFFGKGYGAKTLTEFIDYFRKNIDPKADTFLIDPDCNNPRAKHVYQKAGFEHVCDFMMEGNCSGAGNLHHLLIKKFTPAISIRKSILEDAKNVALVHVQAWQESYQNIISADYLNNISLENRLRLREKILLNDSPEQIHLAACYGDRIIGFCDAGPGFESNKNYRGEIYAIYLLKEFKGLGIGKQLLKKAHHHLIEKNLFPYIAWVLKDNKIASEFYEKNNGLLLEEKTIKIGGKEYAEVAYIFRGK